LWADREVMRAETDRAPGENQRSDFRYHAFVEEVYKFGRRSYTSFVRRSDAATAIGDSRGDPGVLKVRAGKRSRSHCDLSVGVFFFFDKAK